MKRKDGPVGLQVLGLYYIVNNVFIHKAGDIVPVRPPTANPGLPIKRRDGKNPPDSG